ncbi:hypothetical protein [Azospirillum rugosum]|uniref:Restriction alleviation protein Lar n=1 Tax=Azospirillum rugosum TaxID=416170 RepID=A0ABS4SEA5_9PROT|nr:hypothetical protein [Azospirillum rugosum]MBP2290735.1 hypothetical protein [Azospirillum rugosum]MDQ0525624.1 hypothetical protein [Azospirillum rugosum]
MTKHACPVCGDPRAYPIWIDAEPPAGCPHDETWMDGKPRAVNSVTECSYQMRRAAQRAEMRRLCPDAFDDAGNAKPGQFARALEVWAKANPGAALII